MRPSQPEPGSEGTRDRILAAAAKVISRRGYAGARLADISAEANLRTPALYYYFESREALVGEVMVVGQRAVLDHVTDILERMPDSGPVDRLIAAIRAHLEIELGLSAFATAVTRNRGQLPVEAQERFRTDGISYFALWDGLIADLVLSGNLRPDLDLRMARMLVLGMLNWTAEWWEDSEAGLDGIVGTATTLIRNALVV